jgi:hypothetical protein
VPVLSATTRCVGAPHYARLFIPLGTLVTAWEFLRARGSRGCEEMCFFAGRVVADENAPAAQVTSCVLPVTVTNAGHVTLTSEAQTALILDALEARAEVPLASLHTHPDAGPADGGPVHSQIDDHGVAITPDEGLFSIVIAHYAQGSPFAFPRRSSVYERVGAAWRLLAPAERNERIVVCGDVVRVVPVNARYPEGEGDGAHAMARAAR